jgi:thioredoxin reductase
MKKDDLFDLVIIGASAVGCAASIYAARRNLKFIVIAKDIGGEVALSGDVDNWPGIVHTTGIDLADLFHKHMQAYKTPIEEGTEVTGIRQEKNIHIVEAKDGNGTLQEYRAKAVIIGSGIHPRPLGIPGEKEFRGKGVTSCTVCDGPLFKGKVTATIGTGNSALESALMMAEIAKEHYVLTKYPQFKGDQVLIDKLLAKPNVKVLWEAMTTEIVGDSKVTEIRYQTKNLTQSSDGSPYRMIGAKSEIENRKLSLDGIFVHIGMLPQSSFVSIVDKEPSGKIVVDKLCRTGIPGLFAAGDVTDVPYQQIAIATGQGVIAALTSIDYLNKLK